MSSASIPAAAHELTGLVSSWFSVQVAYIGEFGRTADVAKRWPRSQRDIWEHVLEAHRVYTKP